MASEAGEEAMAPQAHTPPILSTPPPPPPPKDKDMDMVELPAPAGWKKKFSPLKKDGTPRRRDAIIFVSPDGEEIKTKKDLERYVKGHPGSPSLSEFDWSTGETPRRSARLSSKTKPIESPKGESGNKRARKRVKETASTENEEVKEEFEKSTAPTIEEKEDATEDVEKEAGETVKDELISESVVDDEPSKISDEIPEKKPEEEPEKPESENDGVLAGNTELVSDSNKADNEVPLGEESQHNKEAVQLSSLYTGNLNSVHLETGSSQIADLQNPSEPVGA